MVYGPVLTVLGHLALAAIGQPLPTSWLRWYATGALAIPGFLGAMFTACGNIPRLIGLTPRHIVVQNAGTTFPIFGRQIDRWAFRSLPTDPTLVILRIWHFDKKHRRRAATIALSRRVDPAEVDHLLRVIARLAK